MDAPKYPPIEDYIKRLEGIGFSTKLRGYAPEEVDAALEGMMRYLEALRGQVAALKEYDDWLRGEAHDEIVGKADRQARLLLQQAKDKAQDIVDSAHEDMRRERQDFEDALRRYTETWNERKDRLDKDLEDYRGYVRSYREQSAAAIEDALAALRNEQRRENREAAARLLPPLPSPPAELNLDQFLRDLAGRPGPEDVSPAGDER